MDEKTIAARIKGERARALANIAARMELPKQQWWLSFADEGGFRGGCVVHAEDFSTALVEASLHDCNPHGEVQALEIPPDRIVPAKWTYRLLSREECEEFDQEMAELFSKSIM